jgi:thiamine-phosphate pyrophosphorylase
MLIADSRAATGDLAGLVRASFAGGVDIVQLREPRATKSDQVSALSSIQQVAAGTNRLVSGYGSAEIAAKAGVDLLQLSAMDGPAAAARPSLSQWALVGRSCHSPALVDAAIADPEVDFFTISPVFNSVGVGEAGLGLVRYAATVASPADASAKPWFAVGGVNLENLAEVLAAGARRVGVTRAITAASDPTAAAVALKDRLLQAWQDDLGPEV